MYWSKSKTENIFLLIAFPYAEKNFSAILTTGF